MRHLITILILCIGIFFNADAQTYTQRIQKQVAGQGTVTIHQDSVIDNLVNNATLGIRSAGRPASKPTPTTKPQTSQTGQTSQTSQTSQVAQPIQTNTGSEAIDTIDTSKKLIRNGYKVSGYRVQAFAGGNSRADRIKAEQIGNNIKAQYADVPVYVHFYSPRWICRVGNYRTYEEAHQMLLSLRKLGYTQATIVKGKITVPY